MQDLLFNNQQQIIITPYQELSQAFAFQQQFRCENGYQAFIACANKKCEKQGLICLNKQCKCIKKHKKCRQIFLKNTLDKILSKLKQPQKYSKQTYQFIHSKINTMIDELSALKIRFQLQQRYFGLNFDQLTLVQAIKQNRNDLINGNLISSTICRFQQFVKYKVPTRLQIQQKFKMFRRKFKTLGKQIEDQCSVKIIHQKILLDSQVLKQGKMQQRNLLEQWIRDFIKIEQKKKLSSILLYRASQNQFSSGQYFKKCDKIQKQLLLVKNQFGKIYGGFTNTNTWISNNQEKSFLFSLNAKQIMNYDPKYQIFFFHNYGPKYGHGDLYICDQANIIKGSNFYPFRQFHIDKDNSKYEEINKDLSILTGQTKRQLFYIKEYQVYQIKIESK